jgi:hypothetical protein
MLDDRRIPFAAGELMFSLPSSEAKPATKLGIPLTISRPTTGAMYDFDTGKVVR